MIKWTELKKWRRDHKVGEHPAVVIFELEAYSEPKVLPASDHEKLMQVFGSTVKVAQYIGASRLTFGSDFVRKENKQ